VDDATGWAWEVVQACIFQPDLLPVAAVLSILSHKALLLLNLSSVSLIHLLGLKQRPEVNLRTYKPTRMHKSVPVFHVGAIKVKCSQHPAALVLVLVLVFEEARKEIWVLA
jgi:hypothetical protein